VTWDWVNLVNPDKLPRADLMTLKYDTHLLVPMYMAQLLKKSRFEYNILVAYTLRQLLSQITTHMQAKCVIHIIVDYNSEVVN